ncbi:hypothetical protein F5890DRAFT_1409889 [Lentinula detonsa]|uniref:Uncharacterized protein n=1 Tax=Lentinula detonsa TaxID=2804962 RepID=A0AA38Q0Q7_9AGAR|nr:hypothetical protein F5890DRAFT_1409889 [Lentinula detonsa]
METLEQNEKNDSVTSLPTTSIIPDALKELPAWYTSEDWSATTSFRTRFPLHNPVGPRYYRNHHLIPPAMYRPGARPPSIFSPSFPAMGTNSMPERFDDATRLPGPSRTPSHSPLPTPSSSQTRVADLGIKPRSRKTSQSAHDNVDLLDVSDPWGTNWHHESPYDIGLGSGPIAADVDPSRSRRSSITTPARRKTVTPSPLSQSTSAIHLQAPLTGGTHLPRKLSKRRGLSGLFGNYGKSHHTASHSLPTSPVADLPSQSRPPLDEKSKRASTMPPPPPSSHKPITAIKKDRRGSIIGRLTKRFSVTRKQPNTVDHEGLPQTEDPSAEFNRSSEKLSKRVPPPSVDNIAVDEITLKAIHDPDRRSSISVEASFPTKGKLMVANPDAPSSEISTPPQVDAPLPVHQTNRGPPPPSSTTKPIPLPDVTIAPPPPSATTKPIPLPDAVAPPPPSATTKPIPLPRSNNLPFGPSGPIQEEPLTHRNSHLSINQAIIEDSPLSAASMLVNPPTPHTNEELAMPAEAAASSVPRRSSPRELSPGISSVTAIQTETFKLVRTQSGNVQTVNDIIPAAGEQWEVVEEISHTRRSSKSKDKERSDRDHIDAREKDRDARREKVHGSHSASPTKPSSSSTRPLERASSKSARPTSEVPSAADLNALRAREAWEMERLYKGRSMYGMEPNGEAVAPTPAMPVPLVPTSNGQIFPSVTSKNNGATHGSSHTSFVVQNFATQGSATQIYHSMPTQPPPVIYASMSSPAVHAPSVSSPPSASSSSSATAAPVQRTSPPVSASSSDILNFIRPPNPLPEPPRETPTPPLARISQSFSDSNNSTKIDRPTEYWTTFAEVSTAH